MSKEYFYHEITFSCEELLAYASGFAGKLIDFKPYVIGDITAGPSYFIEEFVEECLVNNLEGAASNFASLEEFLNENFTKTDWEQILSVSPNKYTDSYINSEGYIAVNIELEVNMDIFNEKLFQKAAYLTNTNDFMKDKTIKEIEWVGEDSKTLNIFFDNDSAFTFYDDGSLTRYNEKTQEAEDMDYE